MIPFPNPQKQITLQKPDVKYFVNYCLMGGAHIIPMDINIHNPMWPGWCNPSIMWDEQDQDFKMIIRNVNYVLHGATYPIKNWSSWGPVFYSIPLEDDRNLKTQNFIGSNKNPETDPWTFQLIRTDAYKPIWEFQGEEDARIVRWDGKLYTTGVRRDDNTEGRGRMELMHISENNYQEVTRVKVKAVDEDSYCEKNWMPIKDMPFHYVQLTNPTVVVKTNPKTGKTEEVVRKERVGGMVDEKFDLLRGSSQVIRWGNYWMALVHTCELWLTASGRKVARYCHLFVLWDDDWNIVRMSPLFSFANYSIEFTCGLEYHDGKFYIPFAIEDNFVFLMTVDEEVIRKFIFNDESVKYADNSDAFIFGKSVRPRFLDIFRPITNENKDRIQACLYESGLWYYNNGQYAAAYCIFTHSADMFEYTYPERFMAARCIADLGHRDNHEISMWMQAIMHDPRRPEAYMAAAMYHKCRNSYIQALYFANMAMERLDRQKGIIYYSHDGIESLYYDCLWESQYYEDSKEYYDQINKECGEDNRIL